MRQVQLAEAQEHLADLVSEAEGGQRITILREGHPVAEIIPFPDLAEPQPTPEERQAAWERLSALMERGIDLGGFKIESRDELYDRG